VRSAFGVSPTREYERVDPAVVAPHWHRHIADIWLMEANVPIARATQYLGMTSRTLGRVYSHHRPDHQSDVSAAFDWKGQAAA
jgi:hypothetical protein